MKVFAISDPHLALLSPYQPDKPPDTYKPMDIFGSSWQDYYALLYANWQSIVSPEDTVLLAGDISWAMTLRQTVHDFAYLAALPGNIIIVKGNHDYWWQSISQVRAALPPNCHALQHSSLVVGSKVVCGSRGWLTPDHQDYREAEDGKIFARELLRLRMALEEGQKKGLPLVVMLHYPPLSYKVEHNEMLDLLQEFFVKLCVYGHIHGSCAKNAVEGLYQGIEFINSSCDRLSFLPRLLWEE
ncbi:MAG: metallophosphoesterase [Clostridiales bacterium]|nr:metallophosphoesterase [Clostridiales bacterium]